jgi:diguanylate cyclase
MTNQANQTYDSHDNLKWQRKILNAFWTVVLISFIADIVAMFIVILLYPQFLHDYLIYTMVIPIGLQLLVMAANEAIERYHKVSRPYTIVLTAILLASILIAASKTVNGIQYVMMLPMLAAQFYFNKRILVFAFITIFISLISLYLLFPLIWNDMTIFEVFALLFILSGAFLILIKMLERGKEMLEQLNKTSQSERELLIKNIVMERLNKTDALTDLYNHKTFHVYLDHLIEQCETNHLPLQLAMIDVDNFKMINDTYGHSVGDIILKRIAGILKQSLTNDEIIARYGGEEFAVIFPGRTMDQTIRMIEQVRETIWQELHPEMEDRQVSVSIGLSDYRSGIGKSRFFAEADSLLYKAKKSGKNKTVIL